MPPDWLRYGSSAVSARYDGHLAFGIAVLDEHELMNP